MKFSNAQILKDRHPETFYAPDLEELRTNTQPGDFVKVCADGKSGIYQAERFWLEVTHIEGDTITGTVANELVCHPLEYGESISVKLEEVYQHIAERPR
jgi:hypothetical protein